MKICYCDESGTGEEPIAVMAGIVVDSQRMHVTKEHWKELLAELSAIVGKELHELHTRNFYSGSGIWKGMDGNKRSDFITRILKWIADRKHHIVFTAIIKAQYQDSLAKGHVHAEVNRLWRFLGLHLMLAMQKAYQREEKTKGNTIFIFDNENKEELRFIDLIKNPPAWTDTYYGKGKKDSPLDQIVDVPYFGDSQDVGLIQVADFVSYFLRRYAEIKENLIPAKYADEEAKVTGWVKQISERSIGCSNIFPSKGRCDCATLFYSHAPKSIRDL